MALVCWTGACVRANVIALGYCQRLPLSRCMANILAEREAGETETERERDTETQRETNRQTGRDRETERDRELFICESKAHNYAFRYSQPLAKQDTFLNLIIHQCTRFNCYDTPHRYTRHGINQVYT